ncbi:MAG: DUF4350 domain-containing protein [Terriglobales bacterium]
MPLDLAPGDRKMMLVLVCAVTVLVVLIVLLTPAKDEDPGFPSTYSPHSHGAKAAFVLLSESGYNVERWTRPPQELPRRAAGTLLVLANPVMHAQPGEREAISGYLTSGGRVLAIGPGAAQLLPRDSITTLKVAQPEWHDIAPVLPSALTRGGPIKTDEYWRWKPDDASVVVHYASADGPAVISYSHGHGEVIWWLNQTPVTNAGIKESGNLELLLNSIGPPSTHVYWDEYYHVGRSGLWARVSDTPLKWLLWQAAAFFAAIVFTYSRRNGPIHALAVTSRLSPLEFVETLGGLYKRVGASGFAVEVAYGRFRHLLTRRLGLQRDVPSERLARAARERLGHKDAELLRTLVECESALRGPELDDKEALRLVRELNRHARALKLVP